MKPTTDSNAVPNATHTPRIFTTGSGTQIVEATDSRLVTVITASDLYESADLYNGRIIFDEAMKEYTIISMQELAPNVSRVELVPSSVLNGRS